MPDSALSIEIWSLERVKPYIKNARKIPPAAVQKVAKSLAEYGWRQPLVVDTEGVLIVGHVRRLAALSLGWTEAPVHVAGDLNPEQVRQYRLMDNRSHDEAKWDMDLLSLELGELQTAGLDLELTGFSGAERDRALLKASPGEDAIPPTPAVPVAIPGDMWLCGPHRVLCGDCTVPENAANLLQDRKPILMVTDPPYGISLDGEWRDRAGLNGHGAAEASYMMNRTKGHTNTTISSDTVADWSHAFELVPSLQVAYVWHASFYTREVLDGLLRIGFMYQQSIIWDKGRPVLMRTPYWYQHEPCWYVRKKNAPWYGKPGENSSIWSYPSPKFIMGSSDEEKFDHPTQKPVELMRKSILNHTSRGELVYEPFLGSGTTLAAAELTERVCVGMEKDPKFIDVIVQRWQKMAGAHATLDGDGRTFEEVTRARKEQPPVPAGATTMPTPSRAGGGVDGA